MLARCFLKSGVSLNWWGTRSLKSEALNWSLCFDWDSTRKVSRFSSILICAEAWVQRSSARCLSWLPSKAFWLVESAEGRSFERAPLQVDFGQRWLQTWLRRSLRRFLAPWAVFVRFFISSQIESLELVLFASRFLLVLLPWPQDLLQFFLILFLSFCVLFLLLQLFQAKSFL